MSAVAKHWTMIAIIAALVATVGWWIWWSYFDTYHLATVDKGVLYRDGVRTMHQFEIAMNKTHVKTIVSLVDDDELTKSPFTEEMDYCRLHHIDVVRIPVTLGGWPDGDQVKHFLAIATDKSRQPVLVHCAQGVRRTGMMVAAYQRSVLGQDAAKTKDELLTFGHSQRTVGDVQRFIDVYDPAAQRMTQQFPVSKE